MVPEVSPKVGQTRCSVFLSGQYMTVDLKREGDRGMAQALRDDVRRHPRGEELRCVRMAQPM